MHLKLKTFAKHLKCPIGTRTISKGPIILDDDGFENWSGAAYWNGTDLAIHRTHLPLTDHDILHDIGHWYIASSEQRKIAEFGLGYVGLPYQIFIEPIISLDEANLQEYLAQIFSIVVGRKLNLSPLLSGQALNLGRTWDLYYNFKYHDWPELLWEEYSLFFSKLIE